MAGELSRPDCLPILEKIEDPQLLLAQIVECVDYKDSRGLKTYILEHKLREESIYWELVLKLGEQISAKVFEEDAGFFDICNRCLVYLVKMGKPKEMLLAILEQMDTFIDDVKYKCFLPLLQMSLFKISAKLFHSLDITLETVSAHIRGLPTPENVTLEGEERKLYHIDKEVVRIVDNVENFLDFLEPFIKSISVSGGPLSDAKKNEALVLKKHLIRLFSFPLNLLDLTHDTDKAKSNSRLCVEKTMELMCYVETDFQRLLVNADIIVQGGVEKKGDDHADGNTMGLDDEDYDNSKNEEKVKDDASINQEELEDEDYVENWDFQLEFDKEAQASLAYILLVEHLGVDKYPQVYRHDFIFEFHLQSLTHMLKNTFYPINYKGLLLCKALSDRIRPGTFEACYLDNPLFMTVFNDLIHIMIKCPVRDHRVLATSLFPKMIQKFQDGGRYQVYQNILSSCTHSGVKGFLITILKDDVSKFIHSGTDMQDSHQAHSSHSSSVFCGAKLRRLICLAISLPDKETSDMLENSDQIISALNFLRFLAVADPYTTNKTGFWNNISEIEKSYLSPLRQGLDMSNAHYKLELKNIREGNDSQDSGGSSKIDIALSAGGVDVPSLEKDEKINLMEKALNTHELIISLLCRVSELFDQKA